jgi:hypothetical protein
MLCNVRAATGENAAGWRRLMRYALTEGSGEPRTKPLKIYATAWLKLLGLTNAGLRNDDAVMFRTIGGGAYSSLAN